MAATTQNLVTVAYADVFDYPLTGTEVSLWRIGQISGKQSPTKQRLLKAGPFFTLPGRRQIIAIRSAREKTAERKWDFIRFVAAKFARIPTVQLVGVTGGLAMNNAREEDDIDLFFITSPGTLWITRLLVTLYTEFMGYRRHLRDTSVQNKVCLNMFMASDSLALSVNDQDLFSAHEVLQMVPLWERDNTYRTFLQANGWARSYLPNAWKARQRTAVPNMYGSFWKTILLPLEPAMRALQLWYMHGHRTTEVITDGALRFHPKDARVWVKERYAARLKRLNIPLDIVFYRR